MLVLDQTREVHLKRVGFIIFNQWRMLHICRWISCFGGFEDLDTWIYTNEEQVKLESDKTTLTGDSVSISSRCLPLIKFQMLNLPSLPSEQIKFVFGARSRMLIWALSPTKVCLREITELSKTLIVLSNEDENNDGLLMMSWKYALNQIGIVSFVQ